MNLNELDKLHSTRVGLIASRLSDGDSVEDNEIFISERVVESIEGKKALIQSFNIEEILTLAPFTPNLYVIVCPYCISLENIDAFIKLTRSGLIIPILISPYERYPEPVSNALNGLDHMSSYEYLLYRDYSLYNSAAGGICHHCVDNYHDELRSIVKGKRRAPDYRFFLEQVLGNLYPFLSPDYELLGDVKGAFQSLDMEHVTQLFDLSFAIHGTRTSQAFGASLMLKEDELSRLPVGIAEETDKAKTATVRLNQIVTEGLGLTIPVNIPIDNYIELITDFRPKIVEIMEVTIEGSKDEEDELSTQSLFKSINEINREIERIKGLKRHMLIEAMVGFAGNNRALTASAFIAGAMGLGGSLIGCISAISVGGAVDALKKSGKIRGNKSINRLGNKIHRDLMPSMSELIAKYVGSNTIPVHVLSIRKQLEGNKD